MSLPVRLALALAVLALLAGAVAWLLGGTEASRTERPRWQSSAQCARCHQAVHAQWQGSHHQIAYLNPEVRKLSDDFRNKECQACHLPRPISRTGFGKRTLPRTTRPDEGVGCIACHLAEDGGIMAVRDRPDAPCAPRRDPRFDSVELCASCHNQHQTTDQWRASRWAAEGVTCNDCHMKEGGGHAFRGAHDLDMLRRAGRFDAALEEGALSLSLTNVGAGHNFPTEERHRAVDIVYRFVDAEGAASEWQRAYRFRQPYRDEEGEDTQLPAGETRTVRIEVPEGAVSAQARLWYRLQPYIDDEHEGSTLLFEREVGVR